MRLKVKLQFQVIELAKAFVFGDDVDTDTIAPGGYLHLPLEEQKKHCLESLHHGFSESVEKGDIIIAGDNFGNGSSREQAPLLLKDLGIRAVFARSFSRIFFRNAINVGLFPGIIVGNHKPKDLEKVDVDVKNNRLLFNDSEIDFIPPDGIALEILNAGGMINFARKMLKKD